MSAFNVPNYRPPKKHYEISEIYLFASEQQWITANVFFGSEKRKTFLPFRFSNLPTNITIGSTVEGGAIPGVRIFKPVESKPGYTTDGSERSGARRWMRGKIGQDGTSSGYVVRQWQSSSLPSEHRKQLFWPFFGNKNKRIPMQTDGRTQRAVDNRLVCDLSAFVRRLSAVQPRDDARSSFLAADQ